MNGDFDAGVIRELAGERVFERGEAYVDEGRVKGIKEQGDVITATVAGTQRYHVQLTLRDKGATAACDCPAAQEAAWCKHAVAVALAWLDRQDRDEPGARAVRTVDDLRAHLSRKDKAELVELLAELAEEHDPVRDRFLLDAAARPGAVDLRTFRRTIARTIRPRTFVDYHNMYDYTRHIDTVVDQIERLLKAGHAREVIDLTDFALEAMEDAMGSVDDSDGGMSPILERLQDLHHRACRRARPDPQALAARLFTWEMRTDWEIFLGAAATYADVLGQSGLAVYRQLAEREWADVPALGPGGKDSEQYGKRFRITQVMEALARATGDIEALVAVKSRDLSYAYHYLQIAETYRDANQPDKALEWAELGVKAFPERTDSRLRAFLAEEYHRRGRHDEAIGVIWNEFSDAPHLEQYQQLKRHADRVDQWPTWRDQALAYLRERADARSVEETRPRWSERLAWVARRDHSTLVEIFLWERDIETAWLEAQAGGCSPQLWLELAGKREKDHPEDAVSIYQAQIEPTLARKNNDAYEDAVELLRKVHRALKRMGREDEFAAYLATVRAKHKPKRNFMKLVDSAKWT
ncbi:MAG TPA: SWIM zinc finger family protein [Candidatus Binatia bacterium]|nr:SWIM zinc finger family protein [Candidatus Binatia bacterium]